MSAAPGARHRFLAQWACAGHGRRSAGRMQARFRCLSRLSQAPERLWREPGCSLGSVPSRPEPAPRCQRPATGARVCEGREHAIIRLQGPSPEHVTAPLQLISGPSGLLLPIGALPAAPGEHLGVWRRALAALRPAILRPRRLPRADGAGPPPWPCAPPDGPSHLPYIAAPPLAAAHAGRRPHRLSCCIT